MDDRTKYIGSSDIATILNLNPHQTILELWAEKTGQIPSKDLSDNEAVEWGTRLEKSGAIADKFAERHKVKLIAYKKRFIHPDYPFFTCELDNIIAGTDEIVEIKTTSLWKYRDWQKPNDVPPQYICQVMWQLGISGRKVGWIAVLVGGQKYLEKKIEFDKKIFDEMVRRAVVFWQDFILKKVMPATISANDSDVLYQLFQPVKVGEEVNLGDELDKIAENIDSQKADLRVLEKEIEQQENLIKSKLGDKEIGLGNNWKATWKLQVQKRLNMEMLKREYSQIYEECLKSIESRVLRISERKEIK